MRKGQKPRDLFACLFYMQHADVVFANIKPTREAIIFWSNLIAFSRLPIRSACPTSGRLSPGLGWGPRAIPAGDLPPTLVILARAPDP